MTVDVHEESPGHRMDPRGHCRCGWELRDAAFHWSGELPVVEAGVRRPSAPPAP